MKMLLMMAMVMLLMIVMVMLLMMVMFAMFLPFGALRCNMNCLACLDAAFNSSTFASSLIIKVFSRLSFFANFPGGSIFIVNALN